MESVLLNGSFLSAIRKFKSMVKFNLVLVYLLVSWFAFSQNDSSKSVVFNHVALSVSDADVSAEFYVRTLDLNEIVNRTEVKGIRWVSLGEGKELHLISVVKDSVIINKAVHFALTLMEFDAFIKRLELSKIPYSDWPGTPNNVSIRADGIKQVYIQDPDGYWIEINSRPLKTA